MTKRKTVICVDGKAGSGKSTLCGYLKGASRAILHINLDQECNWCMNKTYRRAIYEREGIEKLEELLYPQLRRRVESRIELEDEDVILLEGIKSSKLFGDIADYIVEIKTDEEKRLKQLIKREGYDGASRIESFSGRTIPVAYNDALCV